MSGDFVMAHGLKKKWQDENITIQKDGGGCPCCKDKFEAKIVEQKGVNLIVVNIKVAGRLYSIIVNKPEKKARK